MESADVASDLRADVTDSSEKTQPEPATRTSLKFFHSLGFGGSSGDQETLGRKVADHLNDDSLVYLAGKHVAVYSYETQKSHRFILKNPKTSRIIAFCVSANRRYVALSEVLSPEPNGGIQVSVYNFSTASKVRELGRSRFPSGPEGTQPPVVGLDFSRDNKYLATVTSPPNPHVYLWQLDKQRLAGMAEVTHRITQISISPWAHWELCTTGTATLQLWRAQGNQLKATDPLPKEGCGSHKLTCHSWFDTEKLVAGTAEGSILVIENQELRKVIGEVHGPGRGITCLCTVSRGFVAGGDDGVLSLFERTYDSEYFKCFKVMHTPERFLTGPKVKVLDVTINPNEESAICCYDNNEFACISLNQIEYLEDKNDKHNVFKRLPIGFHCDTVTGADVCVQKSVLVTSSVDRHIRVWNFIKKTVDIDKKFDEDVLSVAIHPTGYILVAGFRFKLCVFVVLANDLQVCHEFPNIKQCREVRFSHGGQYFAAVGNPWSRIVVINSYTLQPLGSRDNPNGVPLTGHSASVQSICWSNTDQQLISAGSEGAIYEWRITDHGGKRNEINESVTKSVSYHCIRYDDESQMLVALGSHKPNSSDRDASHDNDITLRTTRFTMEYPPKAPQRTLSKALRISSYSSDRTSKQPRVMRSCQAAISPLAQTLFVGTSDGQLWLYEWPPSDHQRVPEPYCKLEVHQGEVLFVILSLDERHLFTIGAEDKCLFMFNVDIISDGRPVSRKPYPYASFDSVSFVSQQEFDERARLIAELSSHNDELIRQQQAEIQALRETNQKELDRVEVETVEEVNSMRHAMEDSIRVAEEAKEEAARREAMVTEAHMKTAEELEALHTKRIEELEKRHRGLQEDKDDLVTRYENKLHKLGAEIEGEKRQLEMQYKDTEQRLASDVEQLRREIRELYKSINGMVDTTIHDYIIELDGGPGVEGLHEKWKAILAAKESQCSQSKTNTALFKTRREKHRKEIEEVEQQIECRKEQERLLMQKSQEHLKANEALKAEIAQRNDTISASERRILELKKQTAELEKLRYVLTYKFSELRKEVAPKEENIKEMNESIQEMDLDLERIGIDRDNLQQLLSEKDARTHSLMNSLAKHNQALDDKERSTEQLLRELISLVADMDTRNLREHLLEMVRSYSVRYEEDVGASYEKEKAQEFARQREYMESQLASVDSNSRMKESMLRQDNQVKTAENAQLVKEINVMRNEKKQLMQRLQQADSQLKELQAQAQRTSNKEARSTRPFSAPAGPGAKLRRTEKKEEAPPPLKGVHGRGPIRGRLVRGSTRSLKDLCDMNPQKLDEIVSQVNQTNACIKRQTQEIGSLKEHIKELLQGAEKAATSNELLSTLPSVDH